MSRIQKMALAALVVATVGPALAFAGATPKIQHESGIIKSVDLKTHTLVVTAKKLPSQSFQWDEHTKFREHSRTTTADALKQGERVRFTCVPGADRPLLKQVSIEPPKTAKHTASNSGAPGSRGA